MGDGMTGGMDTWVKGFIYLAILVAAALLILASFKTAVNTTDPDGEAVDAIVLGEGAIGEFSNWFLIIALMVIIGIVIKLVSMFT